MYFTLKSIKRPVFALFFHFWAVLGLFIRYFLPDRHKNRQNKIFCLFYRFIEDNFQSFIPWFVRDIR